VRVHTIGIGAAPNTYLMRKMAQRGRGHYTFIADSREAPEAIARFLERLDRPVMEDVRIVGDDVALSETVPAVLPDLYAGVPLMLSAKLEPGTHPGDLVVGGYTRLGWIEQPVSIDRAAQAGAGVAFRWARMRVESILDTLHEGADPTDVRREVVDLALRFRLVTRYTSLVAVEDRPTAGGTPRTARLGAALPIGGTDGPLMRRVGLGLVAFGLLALVALRREVLR
jgi:Ca-activated chloride channel family protein